MLVYYKSAVFVKCYIHRHQSRISYGNRLQQSTSSTLTQPLRQVFLLPRPVMRSNICIMSITLASCCDHSHVASHSSSCSSCWSWRLGGVHGTMCPRNVQHLILDVWRKRASCSVNDRKKVWVITLLSSVNYGNHVLVLWGPCSVQDPPMQ